MGTGHLMLKVYRDRADLWVGLYIGPNHLYFCPLPTLVIRVRRPGRARELDY